MANGPAVNDVTNIVKRYPNASFGVHLCLDEIKPITSKDTFMKFGAIDSNGMLSKDWYKKFRITLKMREVIYKEWKAQIEYILSLGISVSHLDSHHHVHNIPELKSVLLKLSQEFKIRKIRLPLYISPSLRWRLYVPENQMKLQNVNKKNQRIIKRCFLYIKGILGKKFVVNCMKEVFQTTDFFCHASTFFYNLEILRCYDTIEIMCHPGHPAYQKETEMLSKFDFRNIQLISYKDL